MLVSTYDIGGKGVRTLGIPVDPDEIIGQDFPTPIICETRKWKQVREFIGDTYNHDANAISLGVAGMNKKNDLMVISPNFPQLNGKYVATEIDKITGKPVKIFNDMTVTAYGVLPYYPGEPCFMVITWSSGIGLRILINGKIVSECEAGHMTLDLSTFAQICGCKRRGHVEAMISGDVIKKMVQAETQALGIKIPKAVHPNAFMDMAYGHGEAWARILYEYIEQVMGIFLANIKTIFPELSLIVWKGRFAKERLSILEKNIRLTMQSRLIKGIEADEESLQFEMTPAPEDIDSLTGAAVAYKVHSQRS